MKNNIICILFLQFAALTASYAFEIVQNGQPAAVIVIPDNAPSIVRSAAQELAAHIKLASGAELITLKESTADTSELKKIYLGNCQSNSDLYPVNELRNSFICEASDEMLRIAGRDFAGGFSESREFGTLLGVYHLLDKYLQVRWLWPGELGCHVPEKTQITIPNGRINFTPPLLSSRYSQYYRGDYGWSTPDVCKKFLADEFWWERRNGFCWDTTLHSAGHAMNDYYKITDNSIRQQHPEWFNLLPDGSRKSDILHVGNGSSHYISMCVSNPDLHKYIIEQWQKRRTPGEVGYHLPATENDTAGKCLCENCLNYDVPRFTPEQLAEARKKFNDGSHRWADNLNMAGRYCRFYLELQKLAKEVDPNAKVLGFAYANYTEANSEIKLNKDIQIGYVGRLSYPWTQDKIDAVKKDFAQWGQTGCTIKYRPNFMLDGHNMPIFFAYKFHDLFQYLYKNGMRNVYYDSNIGQYAVNGPTMYMLARTVLHPELSADEILNEYYSAFAPAEQEIKEYFEHWRRISESPETLKAFDKSNFAMVGAANGDFNHFYVLAAQIYTPEIIAKGFDLLAQATRKAAGNPIALARIDFLKKGLRNSELTLNTQRCFASGDNDKLAQAVMELDKFRASVEKDNIANMNFLAGREDSRWNRPYLAMQRRFAGKMLTDNWRIFFDEKNQGLTGGFFAHDFDDSSWNSIDVAMPWESTQPGRNWKEQHNGKDFDGFAWYRTTFEIPENLPPGSKVILHFGSVDEACKIYLNGQMLLDRPYPFQNDPDSWRMPFQLDISNVVKPNRNQLTVRVEDNSGLGGITGPVALQIENSVSGANLLQNGSFEATNDGAWQPKSHGNTAALMKYDAQQACDGQYSALISSTTPGQNINWQTFLQKVQVEKGRRYRLHGYFKTSEDMTGLIVIGCEGAIQKHIAFQTNTHERWQEFELNDMPASEDGEVSVLLRVGRKFSGNLWFDNVSLTDMSSDEKNPASGTGNLLPNGDFETPNQNWIRRGPDREIAYDSQKAKSGQYACRLQAVSQGQNGIYQKDIPVQSDKTYSFRCAVYPDKNFTGRLLIQLTGEIKRHQVVQNANGKWTEVIFQNLKPEKDGTVAVYINTMPEGRGTFWIDDASLVAR